MTPVNRKPGEELDFAQALRKAADYCAVSEHCESEIRLKLYTWGLDPSISDKVIERLTDQGFIDDLRYACSFAEGKFHLLQWGKLKISNELRLKRLNSEIISQAIGKIDDSEYSDCLKKLIGKKMHELKSDTLENRNKAARFAMGKGFEPGLVFSMIKNSSED